MEENSKTDLNVFLSIYWSRISLENSWFQAVDRELGPPVRATAQAVITPISDAVTFPQSKSRWCGHKRMKTFLVKQLQ